MGQAAWSYGPAKRIVFIDGFSGPGEYLGGEEGSPLRAYLDHAHREKLKVEFVCMFIDNDEERIDYLKQVAIPRLGQLPEPVTVYCEAGAFDETIQKMFQGPAGKTLAPTFALVDPFGFRDTPMSIIARILNEPGSEVMVTFMTEPVNRFLEHPDDKIARRYDELFDTQDWRDLIRVKKGRLDAVSAFYGKQLAKHARFVWSFRMLDEMNRSIYDLWFATNHIEGLKKMKRAMWKVDPVTGTRFSDRVAQEETLFGAEDLLDGASIGRRLCSAFAGRTVPIEDVELWLLTNTGLHDGQIRRVALTPLEDTGTIAFVAETRKVLSRKRRRGAFPAGSMIRFP